ncbi:uncharacterized protein LOC113214674 [Frankliniella occidentalis]|uniref:Uncharacterized protein LOC113214674 n=1 Tax=Frankliniella occidentalis TaxID=133901 RepID=A0A6J1TGF6_FRAOC|nr:uncharacterized protein LOC113214674 [Frankliniella occidentalis]
MKIAIVACLALLALLVQPSQQLTGGPGPINVHVEAWNTANLVPSCVLAVVSRYGRAYAAESLTAFAQAVTNVNGSYRQLRMTPTIEAWLRTMANTARDTNRAGLAGLIGKLFACVATRIVHRRPW